MSCVSMFFGWIHLLFLVLQGGIFGLFFRRRKLNFWHASQLISQSFSGSSGCLSSVVVLDISLSLDIGRIEKDFFFVIFGLGGIYPIMMSHPLSFPTNPLPLSPPPLSISTHQTLFFLFSSSHLPPLLKSLFEVVLVKMKMLALLMMSWADHSPELIFDSIELVVNLDQFDLLLFLFTHLEIILLSK